MNTRVLIFVCAGVLLTGCTSYRVPSSQNQVNLNLTAQDVDIGQEVHGDGFGFGIFPFYFWLPTVFIAEQGALGEATQNAYENAHADFVFRPRSKIRYYNFFLFDLAWSDVVGRAVRIKQQNPP